MLPFKVYVKQRREAAGATAGIQRRKVCSAQEYRLSLTQMMCSDAEAVPWTLAVTGPKKKKKKLQIKAVAKHAVGNVGRAGYSKAGNTLPLLSDVI